MTGAGAVSTLVLLEWTIGAVAVAAWTQSWGTVRRGHFRILGWTALALAVLAVVANNTATSSGVEDAGAQRGLVVASAVAAAVYLLAQYLRTDIPGVVAGASTAVLGTVALAFTADFVDGWPLYLAAVGLVAGAAFLGGVTNGMLLGHWYLNQPGLKPWVLARLTALGLGTVAISALAGVAGAPRLVDASTEGADIGFVGIGESLGGAFFGIWLTLLAFTGVIVWLARRCVQIRSIQSATGLYYVALLTAGVSEFLVRYLMVNAT